MTHPSWVAQHSMAHSFIDMARLWSMWSVWLVPMTVIFNLSAHLWMRMRGLCKLPDGRDMEKLTSFRLGKEYTKAVNCHPTYLTYMQSTSHKMLGWVNHKMESKLLGEISIISGRQMTSPLWQKVKSLLIKLKEESEKAGLQLNITNTKIMASGPIISWSYSNLFYLVPKSLLMVIAAMKLKHVCSLEEKQWQT